MVNDVVTTMCLKSETLLREGKKGTYIANILAEWMDSLLRESFYSTLNGKKLTLPLSETSFHAGAEKLAGQFEMALVGVGGYGRRALAPFSDIDIMILARNKKKENMEMAQQVLYGFWDLGLDISYSVRTYKECADEANKDQKTRTSLMESRFITGNEAVFREFMADIYPGVLFKGKKQFVGDILRNMSERHRQYGESIYMLEPNLKEGPGGLRDTHCLSWLLKVMFPGDSDYEKIFTREEYRDFYLAGEFILRLRLALHCVAGRKTDVMSFEFQEAASRLIGFRDTRRFYSSEIMMRVYYKKARDVTALLNKAMDIVGRKSLGLGILVGLKKITNDFYLYNHEIVVKDRDIFRDPDKMVEAFSSFALTGRRFSVQLKDLLRRNLLKINKKALPSKGMIKAFFDILRSKRVYETLREMHDVGVLDRLIPEFGWLRHLVIHELYHRYTVDEHSLFAVRSIELLKAGESRGVDVLAEIKGKVKPEVLYFAVLLHDIGKGVGANHEEAGFRMIRDIALRFGMEREDRRKIAILVKHHIFLAKLIFRRDIEAPETIAQVSEVVENEENLNALYLMTYADMKAVNPGFWTEWKANQFLNLYRRTRDHLRGVEYRQAEVEDARLREFVKDMPERYLVSNSIDAIKEDYAMVMRIAEENLVMSVTGKDDGTTELTITTRDMIGLFARVVGVLGTKGLNIINARLYTGMSGIVVDRITISNWHDIWWDGSEDEVKSFMAQALLCEPEGLLSGTVGKSLPVGDMQTYPYRRFESSIEIDNETSEDSTIFEVFLPDRIGLLYAITSRLYSHNIDIVSAIINTEESVAQDVFYLQQDGGKLSSDTIFRLLEQLHYSEIFPLKEDTQSNMGN
jgi:[protein-PII] uridylyltransferase